MKKLMVALGLAASLASAKDMTGRLGLGSSTTLGGVQGLAIEYQISKLLTVEPILSFHMDDNATIFGLGLTGFLNLADMDNANLLVGVGLSIMNNGDLDNPMAMDVSIPIRPVVFFNDRISAHLNTGLNIEFMQMGNDPAVGDFENQTIIDLTGHLFAGAGMTFYF